MTALATQELVDGKYRIVRFVGQGAWASVWEGINVRIHGRVAIKVLEKDAVAKAGVIERFEREAQVATRIESEHVVRVYDLGQLPDGRPYLVMEFLDGEDLAHRIAKSGRLAAERVACLGVQALRGLADAHASGVMHRDVKPDNVVIVQSRHGEEIVKIVDFGISKLESGPTNPNPNVTQANLVLGSPAYMSPEQCRGVGMMDQRSDLYSLGVVLFEAATGHLPHAAETFNELMFKIALDNATDPREFVPDLDPELAAIFLRALRRDPAERFQTANEFEEALLEWGRAKGYETWTWGVGSMTRRTRIGLGHAALERGSNPMGPPRDAEITQDDLEREVPFGLVKTTDRPGERRSGEHRKIASQSPSRTATGDESATRLRRSGDAVDALSTTPSRVPSAPVAGADGAVDTNAPKRSWAKVVGSLAVAMLLGGAGVFALTHGSADRRAAPAAAGATTVTANGNANANTTTPPNAIATADGTSVNPTATASASSNANATATATATGARPAATWPVTWSRAPVPKASAAAPREPPKAMAEAPTPPPATATAPPSATTKSVVDGRTINTNF